MRSSSHVFVSACALPWIWKGGAPYVGDALSFAAVAAGVMAGSKAPDWLEIKRWAWGRRFSVLPHRTITHTWWVWLAAMGYVAYEWGWPSIVSVWFAGFTISALLHIICDAATPMGVPILSPFGKKYRLPGAHTGVGWWLLGFFAAAGFLGWTGGARAIGLQIF